MVPHPTILIQLLTSCSTLYRISPGKHTRWTIMQHVILPTSRTSPSFSFAWQVRIPWNSFFLESLWHSFPIELKREIPPILHYSGEEPYTKYEICLVFAKILGLPHKHIIPDAEPPTGEGATSRPRDCHLYTKETEDLGVEGGLGLSLFEEWWTARLASGQKS